MGMHWRRVLFYCLLSIFFIAGGGVVLYAQGYRLDTGSLTVGKIGAIYVQSVPQDASIFLDGKPVRNKAGLFKSGTLVSHLFPKRYELELRKEGYRDWKQTVAVEPSLVTEAKHATLIPEEPDLVLFGPVKDFWILGDSILFKDDQNRLVVRNQELAGSEVEGWSATFNSVLTKNPNTGNYFLTDLSRATTTHLGIPGRKPLIPARLLIGKGAGSLLMGYSTSSLSFFNARANTFVPFATSTPGNTIADIAPNETFVAWTEYDSKKRSSRIILHNILLGTSREIFRSESPFTLTKWAAPDALGIVDAKKDLFLYSLTRSTVRHVASDVRDFELSQDGTMVATLGSADLEIISLERKEDYWRFPLPKPQHIERMAWYRDGRHIFLVYPNETRFLDFNDELLEHFDVIAPTNKIAYDKEQNRFYYLKDGTLVALDMPK